MSDIHQLGHHPDADHLSAFAENALPAHERETVLLHLSTCAHCREVLALSLPPFEAAEPVPATPQPTSPKPFIYQWLTGWNLTLAGSLAFASIVLIAVLHHRATGPTADQTAKVEPAPQLQSPAVPVPQASPAPEPDKAPAKEPAPIQMSAASPRFQPAPNAMANGSVGGRSSLDTGTVDGVIDNKSVENLPLNGRNYQAFPLVTDKARAGTASVHGSVMGGMAMGQGAAVAQPAAKIPAPAPQNYVAAAPPAPVQSQTVEVAAASSEVTTVDAAAISTLSLQPSPQPLPSHLPTASILTQGNRTLALDTAGALWISTDSGTHWKSVHTPWESRATALHLASAATQNSAAFLAMAPQVARMRKAFAAPASISGTVTDPTGAAIPGSSITVIGSVTKSVRTDSAGKYSLADLPPGTYTLRASAQGFQSHESSFIVTDAQPTTADITLRIGSVSETVTVNGVASNMDTQDSYVLREAKKSKAKEPVFAVETANGEHWVSSDGKHWIKNP